jgi:hypothetical protein
MNVGKVLTKDYENDNAFRPHENKAKQTQSNPIQSQSNPIYRGVASGEVGFKTGAYAALRRLV